MDRFCLTRSVASATLFYAAFSITEARGDWWSDHNPLKQITPNWGPLIPHPQSGGEIIPPCWGSPQTCRGSSAGNGVRGIAPGAAPGLNFSVTHRYNCSDQSSCDVTSYGPSCQQAANNQVGAVQQDGGDPCRHCGPTADWTLYRSWVSTENITGGDCQGW